MKLVCIFICLFTASSISLPAPVNADQALEATGLCHKIEGFMNTLVDYTSTKCLPGIDQGGLSFILISEKPIFSVEASKKAWLIVTVGAVGHVMNAYPNIKGSDIYVSDMNMMKTRKGYKYPMALAKTLQRKAKADQIDIEQLYKQVNAVLAPYVIPQK